MNEPAIASEVTPNDFSGGYRRLQTHRQILVLTDGFSEPFVAKTAASLLRYRNSDIVAIIDRTPGVAKAHDLLGIGGEIPVVQNLTSVSQADALYIGIAPPGGKLPSDWRPIILEALRRKMDIVSGLHDFLCRDNEFVEAAAKTGAQLIDVRRNECNEIAQGHTFREGCTRIHTVGGDCSVGKMVTTIEVDRGLSARGQKSSFLATGQTGIMITGEGVPVDCVVADFVNGATERLAKRNEYQDFLLIEGQGSISHPAYSAVTVGLLHGAAPDGLIFCFEAGRKQVKGLDNVDLPTIASQLDACLVMANLRHPCKFIGFAINTRRLTEVEADAQIAEIESEFKLPACDVYRHGADKLVQACMDLRKELQKE